ncbi:MAG: YicC/YloC family endoribonuclease [Alphaproteobacteria bacterium]
MPLQSMTGFSRIDGVAEGLNWAWEIRSVNGRGLDVRLRTPPGYDFVEVPARAKVAERLSRGSLQINLGIQSDTGGARLTLNEPALEQIGRAIEILKRRFELGPSTAEGLLALRGVLEVQALDTSHEARDALSAELLAGLDAALDDLIGEREREGAVIGGLLATRLDELAEQTAAAELSPARSPEAVRERLEKQIAELFQTHGSLEPSRLHQEAVLLATKADVQEELDRLRGHVEAARALLKSGATVGRRLDFLAQEFNREVNTLCAKSNDLSLTEIGLAMKSTVDQFREQVQNLE